MMLSFVQNWFAPVANPIGVDFGTQRLRLAQVQWMGSEHRLQAAASAAVPAGLRHDPAGRFKWFIQTTRDLLAQGNFRSRRAALVLPAASMFVQHLKMTRLDEEATRKALPWEARGKLPIDPEQAVLRHLIAGELSSDAEPRNEVILMAAQRDLIEQFLLAAEKARLDVVGMDVAPRAVVDCFAHVYRRKMDSEVVNCFVDIGAAGTRVTIARSTAILFCRSIPIGGEHFTRAVADRLNVSEEAAAMLRLRLSTGTPSLDDARSKRELTEPCAGDDRAIEVAEAHSQSPTERPHASATEEALADPIKHLTEEIKLCRRYYESTFPTRPVDRLVFVGGEAHQRWLCLRIAREMQLAAQIGDPMVRMSKISETIVGSGIDRRQAQPGWAAALGLSMGSAMVNAREEVSA